MPTDKLLMSVIGEIASGGEKLPEKVFLPVECGLFMELNLGGIPQ